MCVLRGEKPDWDTAKKVLGEPNFMRSLLEFDKDNIPDSVIRKLRRYVVRRRLECDAEVAERQRLLVSWQISTCLGVSSGLVRVHAGRACSARMRCLVQVDPTVHCCAG